MYVHQVQKDLYLQKYVIIILKNVMIKIQINKRKKTEKKN